MGQKKIDIHADDYALSAHASEDILSCLKMGKLDSISVLTNMECLEEYAKRFHQEKREWPQKPLLSVHLNFVEGHCLASSGELSDLIDNSGYFRNSWGNLFFWNYCPWKYRKIKAELIAEIKAQTECFRKYFGEDYGKDIPLRFDGHQHTQMIPIVYRALGEVIEEQKYLVDYIRITKEPVWPFVKVSSLWKSYRPVNMVKNLLLNIYSLHMEKWVKMKGFSENQMFLWGVLFSGDMDKERVGRLWHPMKAYAEKKGRTLEVLFHPGSTLPEEMRNEFCNEGNKKFYLSKGRSEEYKTLMEL